MCLSFHNFKREKLKYQILYQFKQAEVNKKVQKYQL